jgi:phosphate transport system protein
MNMNDTHIASAFDRDLEAHQALIMKMGGLVETRSSTPPQALETRDEELAEQVRKATAPSTRWKRRSTRRPPA